MPVAPSYARFLAAVGLASVAACVLVEPASGADAPSVTHSAAVSRTNALIAEVRVSLTNPARVFVEYDNPVAGRYRTRLGASATEHAVPIVRLRPETTYDYTVFTVHDADESNAVRGPSGSFTTGSLPAPLASVFTTATGRSSQPLILTDYGKAPQLPTDPEPDTPATTLYMYTQPQPVVDYNYLVFWDEVGAVVWYLRVRHAGAVARPHGEENFVFAPWAGGLWEFTPLGKVTDLAGDIGESHHDLIPLDGGRIIFPVFNYHDVVNGEDGEERKQIIYDSLAVWHSSTGRVEEVWNARNTWDILDPAQHWEPVDSHGQQKWTHLNSMSLGERGNFLLSFRGRSQVASMTPDYGIEWLLHGPESDYEFPDPTDRFYKQHTASQLANGNILLFDNGTERPEAEGGQYSRALELRLDDEAGTATKAWQYRPSPDIFTPAVGSAYRLDSGNTLVTFGIRDEESTQAPLVVVEADANGDAVFRIETVRLHERSARYRAQGGIEAIYGETMLRPPTAFEQRPPPVRLHYERMKRVAAETFNLYLEDRHLVYAKAPCTAEDIALPFSLRVYPKKTYLLEEERQAFGFDNLDFKFFQHGLRWEGGCHAEVPLPDYEIDRIVAGQGVIDDEATAAPASATWSVEIPWRDVHAMP